MKPVEISNAIKELCGIANKLKEFEDDHAKFLEVIKALDRSYLEMEQSKFANDSINHKGILNPVNFVKYVIIDKILSNQNVNIDLLNEIQQNILVINTDYFRDYPDFKEPMLRQEKKNFFRVWTNFSILFYIYYDQYKDKVKSTLSDIAEHLKTRLNLRDAKATPKGFDWNNKYGSSSCWLVLYPADRKNHKDSYQIYMDIQPQNKINYGIETGANLEYKVRELEEQNGTDPDINKLEKYLFTKAKPDYERLNGDENRQLTKNVILYGPPGTGKTYKAFEMAVGIVEPGFEWHSNRKQLIEKFKELQEQGNIKFITFHQSYSYEEFVEGYRYDEESRIPVVESGIFKTLVNSAKADFNSPSKKVELNFIKVHFFKMSLGRTIKGDEDVYDYIYEYCIKNSVIALGWGRNVDFSSAEDRDSVVRIFKENYTGEPESDFNITAMDCFKNKITKGDIIFVSRGNKSLRAIGIVSGDYYYDPKSPIRYNHFREMDWLMADQDIPVEKIMRKRFMQQAIYEINPENLIENNIRNLLARKGSKKNQDYVLVIDEINRGNISKIFGELITLIEEDKRLGMENEMIVTLPYSKEPFGIPPNIHIIGTMNTADRSIALMDVALRRRFKFQEEIPDAKVITGLLGEKEVDAKLIEIIEKTFTVLNKRVEVLLDRDHKIGHSYFLKLSAESAESDLLDVWYNQVIPLLKEYFYNDWDKLKLVLGEYDSQNRRGFVRTLEEDYRGIFENEYEDEFPCEIMFYEEDNFTEVLNNTFAKFRDEFTE